MSIKQNVIEIVESITGKKFDVTQRISKRHEKGIFLFFNDFQFDDGEIDTIINDLSIMFKPLVIEQGFMDNKKNSFDVWLQPNDDANDSYMIIFYEFSKHYLKTLTE